MAKQVDLTNLPDFTAHVQLQPLINALREKKRIVVIAGAGISASAGIPTFDSSSVKLREIFDKNIFIRDVKRHNEMICEMYHLIEATSPTQFHLVIAALAEEGRLLRLYTQNIDGIDTQLAPLKTTIPLLKAKGWPTTVQLHGNLRTLRCEIVPAHIAPFDPALFASKKSLPNCGLCERSEIENKDGRRARSIPVMRPRIWQYNDLDYPDQEAIDEVIFADFRAKPDAVIVAGTALKVKSAKILARDMCRTVHKGGGFTAWINLKASPPPALDCLDLVIKGHCDTVAMHVSSWWLKECPDILNDTQIQNLQEKCKLFIARSAEAALNRALAEVDDEPLSKILQQHENKSRILNVKEGGKPVFISAERAPVSALITSRAANHSGKMPQRPTNPSPAPKSAPPEGSDVLPKLLRCWETEMSERLREVVVREAQIGRESSSTVTRITNLGYREADVAKSLWRLKPGEKLNDEIINAYLELLQRHGSAEQYIAEAGILHLKHGRPWKGADKLIQTGTYSIFIPINYSDHWTFAVLTSKKKGDPVCYDYYDSLDGGLPPNFTDWLHGRFPTIQGVAAKTPKQENYVDCGLFVLMGIRLILAGRQHLSQAQSDDVMPTFRQRVLAELLVSSLNPSSSQFEEFKRKEAHANTILPPANIVGDGSILTTAGDQSYKVESPKSQSSLELFVSPPAVPDPKQITETDSSYAVDSSEDELVQAKPSKQKASKKKKSPVEIASTFAEGASMVKILREAISIERASQKAPTSPNIENMPFTDLWLMISTEKRALKQRHLHYEFSRQFWAEMKKFNRSPHQRGPVPKATIAVVMSKLGITNQTSWKCLLKRAQRASVWTELADIFKDDVKHPSVVLCAISDATYTLETMTLTNREMFFKTIHSKIEEPGNGIRERLKAAETLYWMVMLNNLPVTDLPIESVDGNLPFERLVTLENDGAAYRLTPDQLRDFDDIATDLLIDSIYPEVTIRKNRSKYSSACENREDIVSIIKSVVIEQKNPARAVSLLLQVPEFKTFSDNLVSAKRKEDFRKYIRKYVDIYLPDCPFEVFRTARYAFEPEAAIRARKDIEKGKITYLGGMQARFKGDETPDQDDFSITESSRLRIRSRMLGPVRFANHDCEPNARLESNESSEEVKVIALRKIWTGEEITIFYDLNAFGKDNCDCLCETCKPHPKSIVEKLPHYRVRSTREGIPLDEPTLELMKCHHKDLYGWEWPRTMPD